MAFDRFDVADIHIGEVHNTVPDGIIRDNHYLHSTPAGAKHRYLVSVPMRGIIGAAMWGRPVARNEDQVNTLELTRFWTIDGTPKNAESYILSRMIRDLKQKGYERLIAYASTGEGHEGTIYQATNWEEVGKTDNSSSWENREGRIDRDTSTKIKFEYNLLDR